MKRSEIRYALYRVKAGTASPEQLEIFAALKPEVEALGLSIEDFAEDWDISSIEPYEVVGRKTAQKLKREREGSLFSSQGELKEQDSFIPTKKVSALAYLKESIKKIGV